MSDQPFGQPVRTEADGTDERLHAKLVDFTAPAGVDAQLEISEKLAHVRVFGQDPASTKVQLKLSEEGHPNGQGDYDATTNTKPASSGLVVHDRTATPGVTNQNVRVTGVTNSTVHSVDVALHDEAGAAYSATNPMPVALVGSTEGDEINAYSAASAVAAAGTSNHDYTVSAAKTLILKRVSCAASGRSKYELQIETAAASGVFTSKEVKFITASVNSVEFELGDAPISVATGVKVRVIRTNRDNQAQDLYSTIKGIEI